MNFASCAKLSGQSSPHAPVDSTKTLQDPTNTELRRVEIDVVIPKMVRQQAREHCLDAIDAFTQCCKGRTVSMVWLCRAQNNAMNDCLNTHINDAEYERQKSIYLAQRHGNILKNVKV